jgi:hypothetical protein
MLHEATFSLRVDGDPSRNFTLVAVACCPIVGANCYVIFRDGSHMVVYQEG